VNAGYSSRFYIGSNRLWVDHLVIIHLLIDRSTCSDIRHLCEITLNIFIYSMKFAGFLSQ